MPPDTTAPSQPAVSTIPPARPSLRAAFWLALLGPVFFLSYGFANIHTSRLKDVPSVYFEWERHIPFIEWTILPYMSIDAFYAASLFLCNTRRELDTHAMRLLAATIISVTGFLLFPLKFAFLRPPMEGFSGILFAMLNDFDMPYNQAPSLHVSLLMLLWCIYARHLKAPARWWVHGWFALIGLSVFTTYQHHFIDGVTGVAVGVFCFYLFPDEPFRWSRDGAPISGRRILLATAYLTGAGLCIGLATLAGGWMGLLCWPALSLCMVSLAYAGLGVSVFQKHCERSNWPARIVLAPYLTGAWLSSRYLSRGIAASHEIIPGLWIGRAPGRGDWAHLDAGSVLDLTAECVASPQARLRHYRCTPMLDLTAPTAGQLRHALSALDALRAHPPVLVHCALGYSRSAVVVAAWLMRHGKAANVIEAIAMVRACRPDVLIRDDCLAVLKDLQHV